jgi:hypothetical protein
MMPDPFGQLETCDLFTTHPWNCGSNSSRADLRRQLKSTRSFGPKLNGNLEKRDTEDTERLAIAWKLGRRRSLGSNVCGNDSCGVCDISVTAAGLAFRGAALFRIQATLYYFLVKRPPTAQYHRQVQF